MDTSRIKIKIGQHEFEAEGPTAVVQEQFEAFKSIISSMPLIKDGGQSTDQPQTAPSNVVSSDLAHVDLTKIMRV